MAAIGEAIRQTRGGPVLYGQPDGTFRSRGVPWTDLSGALNETYNLAGLIEDEERARYQGGLSTLVDAYNQSSATLNQGIDPNLLFSRAADSVGARAKGNLQALMQQMGARGINPNSGAAMGMLQRLQFEKQGALVGAQRDVAIENQRQRQANAVVNFQNALNLANYRNSPVGGQRLEATQNLLDFHLADRAVGAQERATKDASRNSMWGTLFQGAGTLAGLIPGL